MLKLAPLHLDQTSRRAPLWLEVSRVWSWSIIFIFVGWEKLTQTKHENWVLLELDLDGCTGPSHLLRVFCDRTVWCVYFVWVGHIWPRTQVKSDGPQDYINSKLKFELDLARPHFKKSYWGVFGCVGKLITLCGRTVWNSMLTEVLVSYQTLSTPKTGYRERYPSGTPQWRIRKIHIFPNDPIMRTSYNTSPFHTSEILKSTLLHYQMSECGIINNRI